MHSDDEQDGGSDKYRHSAEEDGDPDEDRHFAQVLLSLNKSYPSLTPRQNGRQQPPFNLPSHSLDPQGLFVFFQILP